MASMLLIRGEGGWDDRCELDEHDEEMLAPVFRALVAYTTDPENAAVAHERDGETIAAWSAAGALRLADLLPPAYAELAGRLVKRQATRS